MPHREHEAVTVSPDRVVGIEAQLPLPERIDDGRQRHWRPRVAGVGLLHGVHRERADRVDAELVQFGAHFWLLSTAGLLHPRPARGEVRVDWISWARSRSTLVFRTVPPRPRIECRITSISPSLSSTKRADVPGLYEDPEARVSARDSSSEPIYRAGGAMSGCV